MGQAGRLWTYQLPAMPRKQKECGFLGFVHIPCFILFWGGPRADTTPVKTSHCRSNPLLKFCRKGEQVGVQHSGVFRAIQGEWGRAGLFSHCVNPKAREQDSTSLPSLPQDWAGLPASSWQCSNPHVCRAQALRGTQALKSPSDPGLPVTISFCRSPGTKSSPMGWYLSFSKLRALISALKNSKYSLQLAATHCCSYHRGVGGTGSPWLCLGTAQWVSPGSVPNPLKSSG